MALDVLLCAVGFVLLYYGAEWLVKGSSNLARSLGVRPIVIGLTVVAFGTSAPEFVVSVLSSLREQSMIAVGNVLGSNICNIALVLGLAATIQLIACDRSVMRRDLPLMLLISAVVLFLCGNGTLDRLEGAILFSGLLAYTVMNYVFVRRGETEVVEIPDAEEAGTRLVKPRDIALVVACGPIIAIAGASFLDASLAVVVVGLVLICFVVFVAQEDFGLRAGSRLLLVLLICAGIYGVVLGAQAVVDAASRIMYALGVDEKFVGLTIVAFGTSLPELATSVVAAMRREMDISVGNLVGSNVFNLLGVLGVASLVRPIAIPAGFFDSGLHIVGAIMLGTSALPWLTMLFFRRGPTVGRPEGILLLACYGGFLAYLIANA